MINKGGKIRIPNRLWLARKRRGLGQKQVAFLVGKTIPEISRYEQGVKLPELATVLAIEIVYGAPLRLLFKELHEQVLDEVKERIKSQAALEDIYAGLLADGQDEPLLEHCAYEELLRMPNPPASERGKVRDHVTRLAKKLAYL